MFSSIKCFNRYLKDIIYYCLCIPCTHTHLHTHTHMHMHTLAYAHTQIHTLAYAHTNMHTHIHTHTCIPTHTCICTYTHTHTTRRNVIVLIYFKIITSYCRYNYTSYFIIYYKLQSHLSLCFI